VTPAAGLRVTVVGLRVAKGTPRPGAAFLAGGARGWVGCDWRCVLATGRCTVGGIAFGLGGTAMTRGWSGGLRLMGDVAITTSALIADNSALAAASLPFNFCKSPDTELSTRIEYLLPIACRLAIRSSDSSFSACSDTV